MTNLRSTVLSEQEAWRDRASAALGANPQLIAVSRRIPDSRVYASDSRVAVLRSPRSHAPTGVFGLEHEARILAKIGVECSFEQVGGWSILVLDRIQGAPLDQVAPDLSFRERVAILRDVSRELAELHRKGVGHCDLRLDNILVTSNGVELVDFDRSVLGSRLEVAVADWVGISRSGLSYYPFWKLAAYALSPRVESLSRRVMTVARRPRSHTLASGDPLAAAWQLASVSDANAPGQHVAYYSLTVAGRHYPGERPWPLRWEAIRSTVDFRDKRVLELGCNMGLLSCFALLEGAESATGVDHDPTIVDAARVVADALGVGAYFDTVDLVNDPSWEKTLDGADIVVAMSLVHWLPNPSRVFEFLARHRQVLFEGHQPDSVEMARLQNYGFTEITPILTSERGRTVFIASRP